MIEIIPNWHPFFLHFTIALISVSALFYVVGCFTRSSTVGNEILITARWCLWLGAIATAATIATGLLAYYSVAHDTPSHIAMTTHRNWAFATGALITFTLAWSLLSYFKNRALSVLYVVLTVVTFGLLMTTAWLGAELVYRHGIGVMSLPQPMEAKTPSHDQSSHSH